MAFNSCAYSRSFFKVGVIVLWSRIMSSLDIVVESMVILARLSSSHCLLSSKSLSLIAMYRLIFLDWMLILHVILWRRLVCWHALTTILQVSLRILNLKTKVISLFSLRVLLMLRLALNLLVKVRCRSSHRLKVVIILFLYSQSVWSVHKYTCLLEIVKTTATWDTWTNYLPLRAKGCCNAFIVSEFLSYRLVWLFESHHTFVWQCKVSSVRFFRIVDLCVYALSFLNTTWLDSIITPAL